MDYFMTPNSTMLPTDISGEAIYRLIFEAAYEDLERDVDSMPSEEWARIVKNWRRLENKDLSEEEIKHKYVSSSYTELRESILDKLPQELFTIDKDYLSVLNLDQFQMPDKMPTVYQIYRKILDADEQHINTMLAEGTINKEEADFLLVLDTDLILAELPENLDDIIARYDKSIKK